jgi:galactokinase
MRTTETAEAARGGKFDAALSTLYRNNPASLKYQRERYAKAAGEFKRHFGEADVRLFSASGRTEVGGNHTDHNAGRVLAAAVDLDALAVAAKTEGPRIRIYSEGYGMTEVSVNELEPDPAKRYTTAALIAGVSKGLIRAGYRVGGFDAYVTSDVLKGSGLSSSAAFEVCVATILSSLYNGGRVDAVTAAKVSQYAESEFFGKPCGLMDQTTSAVGGFVTIDFESFAEPAIEKVPFDFAQSGHTLCVVDTLGDHADLNDDYAAIAGEMKAVARALGADLLRRATKRAVLENVAKLRKQAGDRAVLRALHFFNDDERVVREVEALKAGDFERFKSLVVESGRSSYMYCQNAYAASRWREQGIPLALAVSEEILRGRGAWRVHGGGFAGTIQAFVPDALLPEYRKALTGIFGEKSFYELTVRPAGAVEVT